MKKFKCPHCEKVFSREKTLIIHSCLKKQRWEDRQKPLNVLAFECYNFFYTKNYNTNTSYEKFIDSNLFTAFIKVAKTILENKFDCRYINWLLEKKISIDYWNQNDWIWEYKKQILLLENIESAITRTTTTMTEWDKTHWCDYFDKVEASQLVFDIVNCKISPWFIILSDKSVKRLESLNEEQKTMIEKIVNIDMWIKKIEKSQEKRFILNFISESGV